MKILGMLGAYFEVRIDDSPSLLSTRDVSVRYSGERFGISLGLYSNGEHDPCQIVDPI